MSYIDEHIEYLGVHEGTKGGSERVEDSSKSAAPYGLDNPPIDRKDKESDKAFAKRVLQHFEKEAINTLGDAYSNAPTGVKRAVLDSYYNSGKLYDGQIASLKGSDYSGFAQNTLDIVSAKDTAKDGISAVSKGLANRKAATYNLMAADAGLPLITGGEFLEVDGKARIIYNTTGDPYTFDFNKPRHTKSDPGALNVIAPKKEKAPGKQSSVFTGEKINVAGTDLDGIFTNEIESQYGKRPKEVIKETETVAKETPNLYANQNLPNAPQDLGVVELPPDQIITPYRETIKEDVTVRPDQIRTTETISVSEPDMYKNYRMQEAARRSMMQGNYEERMADYENARYNAQQNPQNYPRNTGSYALPQQQAAQRMMGGGMGYSQGGTINQAQGLASLGRGGDSMMVHMQPQEVAGLQQMAQANGTSLTRNPMTGMPEAFSLGGMFRAALPIAAGYFSGGAGAGLAGSGIGFSSAASNAIAAGALTGAGVAAVANEDPIMGAVSGGLGGYSGMGMQGAFTGVGDAFTGEAMANSTLPRAAEGASMMTNTGNAALGTTGLTSGVNPGAGFDFGAGFDKLGDNINLITQTEEMIPVNSQVQGGYDRIIDGVPMQKTGNMVEGSFFDKAKVLGGPAASLGLGGLEQSDFEVDVDFDDPRDKYDPYSKLNLNKDTGIRQALATDTGLRLFAEGGEVRPDIPASESVNYNSQGVNLNTVGGGAPPVPPSAMKLVAQAGTSGNKTSPFGGYQGMIPDDFDAQAGGYNKPNYTRNPYSGEFKITPYHDNFDLRGSDRDNNPFEPFRTFGYKNKPDPTSPTMTRPNPSYSPATMTRAQYDATSPRYKFNQFRPKYLPGDVSRPSAQSASLNLDSELNLDEPDSFAEGGNVAGDQKQALNLNSGSNVAGNNAGLRGLNLNTGMMGVSAADLAAAAIAAKPKTPPMKLAMGQGLRPEDAIMQGPAQNYDRLIDGSYRKRYAQGGYLKGPGDGMSDDIPATINGEQPAALADGEFVVPADVVSHLGNGSSEAGSKQLYAMMDRIRKARTGKKSQGKEIKPGKYMPR